MISLISYGCLRLRLALHVEEHPVTGMVLFSDRQFLGADCVSRTHLVDNHRFQRGHRSVLVGKFTTMELYRNLDGMTSFDELGCLVHLGVEIVFADVRTKRDGLLFGTTSVFTVLLVLLLLSLFLNYNIT